MFLCVWAVCGFKDEFTHFKHKLKLTWRGGGLILRGKFLYMYVIASCNMVSELFVSRQAILFPLFCECKTNF